MTHTIVQGYADHYGCKELNGLANGAEYHKSNADNTHPDFPYGCYWTQPGLRVTRLRLLSDPGYPEWDVSYCDGQLNGYHVSVDLPFSSLPKRNTAAAIVRAAQVDGAYAKGLGILDNISTLN